MQNKTLSTFLTDLDRIIGPTGDEDGVGAYIRKELVGFCDEHRTDPLGNQIFVKKGKLSNFSIMIAAHMDEIGFVVRYIDDNGFLFLAPHGVHDDRMIQNQVMAIQTEKGVVYGVTGTKPAHVLTEAERQKAVPLADIYIDVGTKSREETNALGVQVGDSLVWDRQGRFLNGGKIYTGKSIDNRAGCAVLIEVIRRLSEKDVAPTVYAVATVQEEASARGAGTAAFALQPTIGLAVDVTIAGDTPDVDFKSLPITLGAGPGIKYYDSALDGLIGNAVPRKLTRRLESTAKAYGIPFQREVLVGGGTDAWSISLSGQGVVAGCVSIPSRYIHSAVGMIHMDDLENTVNLVVRFIEGLNEGWV